MISDRTVVDALIRRYAPQLRDALVVTYVIVHRDRIGRDGIDVRGGVPGIWGYSYVHTYNRWADTNPDDKIRMEGGIATSYYVVRALCRLARLGLPVLPEQVVHDTLEFFGFRSDRTGNFGILRAMPRGGKKVDVNLRHTCHGLLTLLEFEAAGHVMPARLESRLYRAAEHVFGARSHDELLARWFEESWPIGGIAAYIAARDALLESRYATHVGTAERKAWAYSRARLLDMLCSLRSRDIERLRDRLKPEEPRDGEVRLSEHWPFWHPIFDKEVLRAHSTLGCLALVGNGIAERPRGRDRLRQLTSALAAEFEAHGHPVFARGGAASMTAASAYLEMLLGPWQTGEDNGRLHLLDAVLRFVSERWRDPTVYAEYWSEFTAQTLSLEPMLRGVDMAGVVSRGNSLLRRLELAPLDLPGMTDDGDDSLDDLQAVLERILPVAIGAS